MGQGENDAINMTTSNKAMIFGKALGQIADA